MDHSVRRCIYLYFCLANTRHSLYVTLEQTAVLNSSELT